jgi:triosephosphate isomerase
VLIAGNWKMFKGPAEAGDFCRALRAADLPENVNIVVCPPFVSLAAATQALAGTEIGVFAQNCHWGSEGAFTGEVSAAMLLELGAYGTLVGHSERRQYFGETDETVGRRVRAALGAGLHVIACVGETEAEREAGETEAVLHRQLAVLEPDDNLVIAYEPVWAIGTGRSATPELAEEAHELIRSRIDAPVLYGGSVKPENAGELLAQPAVDGALVGGASLDLDSFAGICRAASNLW